MRILTDSLMIGFAVAASIYDYKRKRIPVRFLWIYTLVTFLCGSIHIEGILIGLLFWGVSKLTNEAIGYGDSWLITLFGMYLGGKNLIRLLFTSSLLAGIVSLGYMWKHGWDRRGSLPFVPFLMLGLLEVILL